MNKQLFTTFILAISFFCNVQASSSFTQDSIKTVKDGNEVITTIYVTASQAENIQLGFWLMGVKHSGNTYSTYAIKINDIEQDGYLQTSKGDWQYIRPTGQSSFSLASGSNQIQIVGTLNDIPNIGYVTRHLSHPPFLNEDPDDYYALEKQHRHHSYPNVEVNPFEAQIDYNKNYYFSTVTNNTLYPPTYFTAHLDKETFYTFYRIEYYSAGQEVTFQTDTIGNVHHVLHVFSMSDPANHSWSASSTQDTGGHANLFVNITYSDFYYVLVRAYTEDNWGTCNLRINDDRFFEDIPVNLNRTDIHVDNPYKTYACFAKGTNVDPIILLIDDNSINGIGQVINYNDDYPYNPDNSSYDWGKNARINQLLPNNSWILTIPKLSSYFFPCYFDTYTGCQMEENLGYSNTFPNLHTDDYLRSSISTWLKDENYNCLSWALGEWMIGLWFGEDVDSTVESVDSLFAIYGFTRDGATANNADIDLWAINNNGSYECKHASVRAKRQNFAAGYDWESKLGSSERIFHPRNSLSGGQYGNIIAHYRRLPPDPFSPSLINDSIYPPYPPGPNRIICNIELSEAEKETVSNTMRTVPVAEKNQFEYLYNSCRQASILEVSIFIEQFEEIAEYGVLLDYCQKNPQLLPLVIQKVIDDEVLGVKLLYDLTKTEYPQLWISANAELSRNQRTANNIPIIYTLQAKARLFLKLFLNETDVARALAEASTFSNDDVFSITIDGNTMSVSFSLNTDAVVTVALADIYGANIHYLVDTKRMDKGDHKVVFAKPAPGLYTICLKEGNAVYEKRIVVK